MLTAGWLIGGAVLMLLELLAPGIFLIWIGGAALMTGLLAWGLPAMDWKLQALCFVVLAGIAVLTATRFKPAPREDNEQLNRRGEQMVGQVLKLENAIVNGVGRARAGDSSWRVEGPDLPAGAKVRVVAAEGASLKVVPA